MSNYTSYSAVRAGLGSSKRIDKNDRYVYSRFYGPYDYSGATSDAIAAVTDAAINQLRPADGGAFQVRLEQAFAGSAPQVSVGTYGALVTLDAADNDGFGMDLGYGAAGSEVPNSMGAFTVGTDPAFFVRVKLMVADVSDSDQIAVGFVKGGWPVDGLLDTYTDYAVLNIDNGDIKAETRVNSGTAGAVDTTQNVIDHASDEDNAVTLEVRVNAGGVVKFLVNGAEPTTDVTGFEFDDDTVNAVLIVLTDVAGDPGVEVLEWESGFIAGRGLDSTGDLVEELQSAN
jgi:hypothetical protein